ncbi:MAG: SWIM zinc finger family protein [Paludibacteraceae bacterium]
MQLALKNGIITEHICDCPYDFGTVCKHLAAVISYLHQKIILHHIGETSR